MNKRPAFFGYNDASKITVVYLPNANQMYPSGQSTAELEHTPAETSGMIKNGAQVAIMGGSANLAMLLLDLQLVHIVLGINEGPRGDNGLALRVADYCIPCISGTGCISTFTFLGQTSSRNDDTLTIPSKAHSQVDESSKDTLIN